MTPDIGSLAVIRVDPGATAVARPVYKSMVATPIFDDSQFHDASSFGVRVFVVVPSRNVPIAVNCCCVVVVIEMIVGLICSIAMDANGVLVTVSIVVPVAPLIGSIP